MKKKVLALVMALVLVLGMSSAFALNCRYTQFDWACPTTCFDGRGKVEIVPYVRSNNCDATSYVWEESSCASAINGEDIYFAIKLTVEPNPDAAGNGDAQPEYWWNTATLDISGTGVSIYTTDSRGDTMRLANEVRRPFDPTNTGSWQIWSGIDWDADETKTYYYNFDADQNGTPTTTTPANLFWTEEADAKVNRQTLENHLWAARVTEAARAEICATIRAEYSGETMSTSNNPIVSGRPDYWTYGDYEVIIRNNNGINASGDDYTIRISSGSKYVRIEVVNGKVNAIESNDPAFLSQVKYDFMLTDCVVGTCMNKDSIRKNFGWKDKIQSCTKWNTKGSAIVDTQCVINAVEIPKTGDVSVIAYAVMALVAAAGAMGLKK